MKIILAAVNSQFVHSNLAVWQLKAAIPSPLADEVLVREYTINQQQKWVYTDLLAQSPDILCFSVYLWNSSFVLQLCEDLHWALPNLKLVLGGPEVSFDSAALLEAHPYLTAILVGEGEETLPSILTALKGRRPLSLLDGVTCRRDDGSIQEGAYQTVPSFASLPTPYTTEMLEAVKGRIVYYEASRGCPFSCSYCLSQLGHGVREKPIEKVKRDLLYLEKMGVPLLKFVDRTFNCNSKRAVALWTFAAKTLKTMRLHFEIGADLINQEQLEALKLFKPGQIQLEAGVQSTNPDTLKEVCRTMDLNRLKENSKAILALGGIHYHLDLIAGLPFESYDRFAQSFDDIYELQPHQLQLGFLKMLKGTKLRAQAQTFDYHYRSNPPYEIINNQFISSSQLARLGCVEEVVERYYNSGRFLLSLPLLIKKFQSPFRFFEALAQTLYCDGSLSRSVAAAAQFTALLEFSAGYFGKDELNCFACCLHMDWLLCGFRGTLPRGLEREPLPKGWRNWLERFMESHGFEELGLKRPSGPKEFHQNYELVLFPQNPLAGHPNNEKTLYILCQAQQDAIHGRITAVPVPEKYLTNGFTMTSA